MDDDGGGVSMTYLMMDAATAAMLRGATEGDEHRIDPRETVGALFAVPLAVRSDPAFGWLDDVLDALSVANLAPEDWPVLAD